MAIVPADVLGWWDCQEGTGSTINDETSNNRDASKGSSVSWTTGGPTNLPNGLSFPGGGDANSKCVVSFDYDYSEATMAVWVNVTSAPSETNWVIGLGNGGGEGDVLIENNTGYKIVGIANNGADRKIVNGTAISTNTLYHVVYCVKSGAFELFVNGSSVGTNTGTGTLADAGNNFVWGQRSNEGNTRHLVGKIHQVCLFNRALTSAEVSQLYNGGSGRVYANAFGQTFSVSDTVTPAETVTALRARLFSVSETATISESVTAALGRIFSAADTATVTDAVTALRARAFSALDALAVTEPVVYVKKLWETVARAVSSFTRPPSDGGTWTRPDNPNAV